MAANFNHSVQQFTTCSHHLKGSCRNTKTVIRLNGQAFVGCDYKGEKKLHLSLEEKNRNVNVRVCGAYCYAEFLHDPINCLNDGGCENCKYGTCTYKDLCGKKHDPNLRYQNYMRKTYIRCAKFGKEYCNKLKCNFNHDNECPNELKFCLEVANNKIPAGCSNELCQFNHNYYEYKDCNFSNKNVIVPIFDFPPISDKIIIKNTTIITTTWVQITKIYLPELKTNENIYKLKPVQNSSIDPYFKSKYVSKKNLNSDIDSDLEDQNNEPELNDTKNKIIIKTVIKTSNEKRKKQNKEDPVDENWKDFKNSVDEITDKMIEKIKINPKLYSGIKITINVVTKSNLEKSKEKYIKLFNTKINKEHLKDEKFKISYNKILMLMKNLDNCNRKVEKNTIKADINREKRILLVLLRNLNNSIMQSELDSDTDSIIDNESDNESNF